MELVVLQLGLVAVADLYKEAVSQVVDLEVEVGRGMQLEMELEMKCIQVVVGVEGAKELQERSNVRRYQGTSLSFIAKDYNEDEGRPHLEKNGMHNAEGSRCTKKLIMTKHEKLRLRSVTLQTDDDLSTDESEEDPRCVEANDSTVWI